MFSSYILITESEVPNNSNSNLNSNTLWLYEVSNLNPISKYCLIPETSSSSNSKDDGISQHTLCHLSNEYAFVASATKPLIYIWNLNFKAYLKLKLKYFFLSFY